MCKTTSSSIPTQPSSLALTGDDGHVYLLVKDAGSRMFFKDKQLLNRPMRLSGRLVADGKMLQVLAVRSVVNGKLALGPTDDRGVVGSLDAPTRR